MDWKVFFAISGPYLVGFSVMLVGLALLRRRAQKRRSRMRSAETRFTGTSGTTAWEAINGKVTLSDLPEPKNFENR